LGLNTCGCCGSAFQKTQTVHNFCSDKCHTKKRSAEKTASNRAKLKEIPCAFCGSMFKQKRTWSTVCSRNCGHALHYRKRNGNKPISDGVRTPRLPKPCLACGSLIPPRTERAYCSDKCRLSVRPKTKAKGPSLMGYSCKECGSGFTARAKKSRRFCSDDCSYKFHGKIAKSKPINRVKHALRGRLAALIKSAKATKKRSAIKLIGCTPMFLVKWLEQQFQPGMSWANYGRWHIDHIRPCAAFNLFDLKEQGKCFHYSNLQPLWCADNCAKGAKTIVQTWFPQLSAAS
jgi:predicted nucleic acid-binding Zn ribbon protein